MSEKGRKWRETMWAKFDDRPPTPKWLRQGIPGFVYGLTTGVGQGLMYVLLTVHEELDTEE